MCVNAAAQIGQAQTEGASLRSTDLVFEPGAVTAGKYHFPIGTAGAVGLVLQTVYLPLALAADTPSEVTLQGGTHVQASPCFHFLDTTWRPYIEMLGIHVSLEMRHPGFYPRGGGLVLASVQPAKRLAGVRISERGAVTSITGFSAVAGLPEEIAVRQMRQAQLRLQHTSLRVDISLERWPGRPGTVIGLIVDSSPVPTLCFGLGARGKLAERVADEASDQVLAYLDRASHRRSAQRRSIGITVRAGLRTIGVQRDRSDQPSNDKHQRDSPIRGPGDRLRWRDGKIGSGPDLLRINSECP